MKLGIHTALRGWTDAARAVADALQAQVFLWMEQNRPQDALAYPNAVHIFRSDDSPIAILSNMKRIVRARDAFARLSHTQCSDHA